MTLDEAKLNTFLDKAVTDLAAGYGGVMVSLGHKLGLYQAMAEVGRLRSNEIAARANCAERYVREWLSSQAAAGYTDYFPEDATYELPAEHAYVLADTTSPVHIPPAWEVPASMWFDEEKALEAFRTGDGVPWGNHHRRLYCGVAAFYANAYRGELVPNWLPALEGVERKLANGALVADVGCGHGHSTIIMAEGYPKSRFVGYDTHDKSIVAARTNAENAGVDDRVEFAVADASSFPNRSFDLICYFDCLHDMGDPVGAARHAKETLKEDGTVMLIEPFANDRLEENLNPVGRLYYAASTTLCCAHARSEGSQNPLGAQAGEAQLADVFRKAGFGTFRRATQTPFNMVLEAKP